MSTRLRLRQLEALECVAETGSMTRAADVLGISQPAVSRLLSDLGLERRARDVTPDLQSYINGGAGHARG